MFLRFFSQTSAAWSVRTTNFGPQTYPLKWSRVATTANSSRHGLGTEVLHPPPTTLQEWYHFVQGNDTNQNRGVPKDLIGMHYAIWAIFKMAAFEKDENNTRSICDCY